MAEATPVQIVPPVSAAEVEKAAESVDAVVKAGKAAVSDVEATAESVKRSGFKAFFGAVADAVNGNQPVLATMAAGAASAFGLHLPATEIAEIVAGVAIVSTWIEKF